MSNRARAFLIATTIVSATVAAPLLGSDTARAQTAAVSIENFAFSPTPITVPVGATVTWTNKDTAPHTATGDANEFDSSVLDQGKSFSSTFRSAGTFAYHCDIHPFMKGTIIVSAGGTSPTSTPVPPTTAPTTAPTVPGPPSTNTPIPSATATTPPPTSTSTPTPAATAKPSARLQLSVSPSKLRAGATTTLTVTVRASGTHKVVSGVALTVNGKAIGMKSLLHGRTDSHGKAGFKNVRAPRKGTVRITATKKGFVAGSASIKVQ